MATTTIDLSLVIPLYNEEEVFGELLSRLTDFVSALQASAAGLARNVEVIFVDDGSRDATPALIQQACATHSWCRGVIFSRNFGHQTAVTAGMQHTRGRAVAILDGDLQDPPEVVTEFLGKMRDGYDVVYAIRTK
ncbi:MAG: glycosyltransferase family 2 protein, partial [Phycisphaerae bacterium]